MRLTILTENTAGSKFLAEHGLSYLIEMDDEKILFDTGHSDVFLKNAELLGIDIKRQVKNIVLSHGHWDHGNGLKFLEGKTLITHPASIEKSFRKIGGSQVGLNLSKQELKKRFHLLLTKKPLQLTPNLYFLGEIPRVTNFESKTTPFCFENGEEDFIDDDSALAAIVKKELVIITGCSHSGICNICEYAKKVTGIDKISTVIGGFHLKQQNKQSSETIRYFKKESVKNVFPSHCTDLPALSMFYNELKIQQVKTGMIFEF